MESIKKALDIFQLRLNCPATSVLRVLCI